MKWVNALARWVVVVSLVAAGLFAGRPAVAAPVPAERAAVSAALPVVWVEVSPSVWQYWYWATRDSVSYLDSLTARSVMRYGPCRAGARCIKIRELYIRSDWVGVTTFYGSTAYIYLNPRQHFQPRYWKTWVVTHELGHAFYLNHYPYCTSVMYYRLGCGGTFRPAERERLWYQ